MQPVELLRAWLPGSGGVGGGGGVREGEEGCGRGRRGAVVL